MLLCAACIWDPVFAQQASEDPTGEAPAAGRAGGAVLEEIIVSATKRNESLQNVPISVAVVTSDDIDRKGLVSAEDYLRGIPGVTQLGASDGETIIIRGIETSPTYQNFFGAATVATYFGETPTTSSRGAASFANIDLMLADIERVEVLRGPQGTSFGSSSLGGTVRVIPAAPKLDQAEASVSAGYSVTSGTGGGNYELQAVGNLPLAEDRFAVRAVGYRYEDSGYYQNVAGSDPAFKALATELGAEDYAMDSKEVGDSTTTGGRISALLQATDELAVTLSYISQSGEVDGAGIANWGMYQQANLLVAPEHVYRGKAIGVSDADIDIANLIVEYDLDWGSLLATYSHVESEAIYTYSGGGPILRALSSVYLGRHNGDIGEIRLVSQLDGAWNFLVGVYIEDLDDKADFYRLWFGSPELNPYEPGTTGDVGEYLTERGLKQKAAFGEMAWDILPDWTLTVGARRYDYERSELTSSGGGFYGEVSPTPIAADETGTSFRGNLSYSLSDNAMVYTSWSQGFRLGRAQTGLNANCDPDGDGLVEGTDIPIASTREVRSDQIDNYEIGAKFTILDRRLAIAADVFRLDWTDVPVLIGVEELGATVGLEQGCYPYYTANVGVARSEGAELQLSYFVTDAVRLDFGGSHIRARLTEDVPALNAQAGDRLPASPEVNANLSLQYEFEIGDYPAFVRADTIYVGPFYGNLQETLYSRAGDYVEADISGRVTIRNWDLTLFANNITNEDAFTFRAQAANVSIPTGYRLRPRTIGLRLAYRF
jgi:outer membrane receptor protein involved in Fe transport